MADACRAESSLEQCSVKKRHPLPTPHWLIVGARQALPSNHQQRSNNNTQSSSISNNKQSSIISSNSIDSIGSINSINTSVNVNSNIISAINTGGNIGNYIFVVDFCEQLLFWRFLSRVVCVIVKSGEVIFLAVVSLARSTRASGACPIFYSSPSAAAYASITSCTSLLEPIMMGTR